MHLVSYNYTIHSAMLNKLKLARESLSTMSGTCLYGALHKLCASDPCYFPLSSDVIEDIKLCIFTLCSVDLRLHVSVLTDELHLCDLQPPT